MFAKRLFAAFLAVGILTAATVVVVAVSAPVTYAKSDTGNDN